MKKYLFLFLEIFYLILFTTLNGQVQWVESRWEDFRDGQIDPAMYVSRRATSSDPDSGCIEFSARFDVNNDGLFDLCCSDWLGPYLRLYYGANPQICSLFPISVGGNIDLADLNCDGYPELIHSGEGSGNCKIYWGTSRGPTNLNPTSLPNGGAEAVYAFDLDKDGFMDIILAGMSVANIYIYWGDINGYHPTNRLIIPTLNKWAHNIEIADFDKDGWGDIALANCEGNVNTIIYWGPNRTYREIRRVPFVGNNSHGLSVADLNKDGYLDLICTSIGDTRSYIYWGSSNGIDTLQITSINPGKCYGGSACFDFNRDGWLDIIYFRGEGMSGTSRKPVIYYNTGFPPYFSNGNSQEIGSLSFIMTGGFVADFNFDNNIDIFINCSGSNSYILWGPNFTTYTAFPVNRDHHGVFREIGNIYDRSFSGYYISNIFDVQQTVTNGAVSWIPYEPPGSQVVLKARGGTLVGADTFWTNWVSLTNNAELPFEILGMRLYQYKAEFYYEKPCNLPWLERVQFVFNYSPGMYQIVTLAPEERVSQVMQGGIFHRYYKITDSIGNPIPYAFVIVSCENKFYSFRADSNGIVDISFGKMNQPPGTHLTGRILSINGIPITPRQFEIEILERKYERSYVFDGSTEAGISVGPGVSLILNKTKGLALSGTASTPDVLRITDKASLGGSLSPVGGAIGISVSYNEKSLGAYVEGEICAGGGLFEAGCFRFPYPVPQESLLDVAALLLFLDPSGFVKGSQYIAPIIQWILGRSINDPLRRVREKGEVGIDIFGGAGGGFYVGNILPIGLPFGLLGRFSVNGEIGGFIHGIISYQKLYQENLNMINIEHYGCFQRGISADFVFNPLPNIGREVRAILDEWRYNFSGEVHSGIGIFVNSLMQIEKIKLYFIKKPSQSEQLEINEFLFTSPDPQIMDEFINSFLSNLLIAQIFRAIYGFSAIIVSPISFPASCYQIFQKALEMQQMGRNFQISYKKYIAHKDVLQSFSFRLGFIIPIDISLGIDYKVRNEKSLLIEYGKWLNGRFYKLCEYRDDQYTQVRNDVNNVPKILLRQVLTPNIIEEIFRWIAGIMPGEIASTQGLHLEIGNCRLYIPNGARPAGESIGILNWFWAPETGSAKNALEKFRKLQQLQARLQYGIGGFYAIHPDTANLAIPAELIISYPDSEVVGVNESLLAIYRWDDRQHKWIYIGGLINIDSNFVKTNIRRFGIYTIAPAIPSETIPLNPIPDSLPANGIDTVVVRGGPIYNNNGTLVPDNTLITVFTSAGTILTPDADTLIPGIQVLTSQGFIEFKIRAPIYAATSHITAISVYGDAKGSASVKFYDIIPPSSPTICQAYVSDSINVIISWHRNSENDILGYKLYYDSDSLPPYQGQSPYDLPSPIDVGSDTTRILALPLHPDSTFYIRVTAYDISKNESDYSELIKIFGMQVFDTIPPLPPQLVSPQLNSAVNDSLPRFIWRQSFDNLTGISHYLLRYYNNNGIDTTIIVNDTTVLPLNPLPDTIYFWQVKAYDRTGNASEWSEIWSFEIDTRIPSRPTLINPQNDTCLNHLNVFFNWTEVRSLRDKQRNISNEKLHLECQINKGNFLNEIKFQEKINEQIKNLINEKMIDVSEIRYILEIDTNRLFINPIITETLAVTYDTIDLFESQFYWRVRAYDLAGNQGDYSDTFCFIADTTKPSVPILIYPPNDSSIKDTFIWHRANDNLSGVKGYKIQIAYDSLFNELILDTILNSPTDTMIVFRPDSNGYWRVKSIDRALNESNWSEIRRYLNILEENKVAFLPSVFILYPNYPNPFSKTTEIRYGLPVKGRVRIIIYNSSGQEVATLINGIQKPGWYSLKWNGKDNKGRECPTGIYFYRLECDEHRITKKMVKTK